MSEPENALPENTPASADSAPSSPPKKRLSVGALVVWGGLAALLLAVGLMLHRAQKHGIAIGDPLPENLTLTAFDGTTYRMGDLKGKVVLLNFWASWCDTCKDEAVALEQAWETLQPRGDVLFLGLDYVDTEPDALAYLKRYGVTYPNGPDKATRWAQTFRLTGVPETYIVDKNGRLAYKKIGPFRSLEEIMAALQQVLEK